MNYLITFLILLTIMYITGPIPATIVEAEYIKVNKNVACGNGCYHQIVLNVITPSEKKGQSIFITCRDYLASSVFDSIGTIYRFEIDSTNFTRLFNPLLGNNINNIRYLEEIVY